MKTDAERQAELEHHLRVHRATWGDEISHRVLDVNLSVPDKDVLRKNGYVRIPRMLNDDGTSSAIMSFK